jgi:hypothetical protein
MLQKEPGMLAEALVNSISKLGSTVANFLICLRSSKSLLGAFSG